MKSKKWKSEKRKPEKLKSEKGKIEKRKSEKRKIEAEKREAGCGSAVIRGKCRQNDRFSSSARGNAASDPAERDAQTTTVDIDDPTFSQRRA